MGRGATGAKGPFVAFLNALSSIIAVEGKLPVNIMFLAEGEEIMGSPTYRDFVERYRDRLQARPRELLRRQQRRAPAAAASTWAWASRA
jgi:acetylornithine deacetylase/succinyl-diaminopimelate desuccinylase-like protein